MNNIENNLYPIKINQINFTREQQDFICFVIGKWYLEWKDKIVINKYCPKLGLAKEHLKILLLGENASNIVRNPLLLTPIENYNPEDPRFGAFTTRIINCLREKNIKTIGDLVKCSERDLLKIHNLAKISLKYIKQELAKGNLYLNTEDTLFKVKY